MSEYYNPFRVFNEAKERTSKDIKLTPLKEFSTMKTVGKPWREKEIIADMGNKWSDVAKYLVMALARTELLPKWTKEEIINVLQDPNAIDKQYRAVLKPGGDGNLNDGQKQAKAKEIWRHILNKQGEQQAEVAKTIESGARKGKFVLASEFLKTSSHIETAILQAIKALKQISDSDPEYKFDESTLLNFKTEGQETTTKFMSRLISKVVTELQTALDKYDFDKRVADTLWTISDNISEANKNILWPESDHDITSMAALEKYFRTLRSSEEMKRGDKVLGQLNKGIGYKKKGKMEAKKEENYDKDFLKLMYDATNETKGLYPEDDKYDPMVRALAKRYLKENPWLKKYLIKEEGMPADSDDSEIEDELVSQLSFHISKLKQKLGRKHNV